MANTNEELLTVALQENIQLKNKLESISESNFEESAKKMENFESEFGTLEDVKESLQVAHDTVQDLKGKLETVNEALAVQVESVESFTSKLGTVKEVEESMDRAADLLSKYNKFGSISEVQALAIEVAKYREIGTVGEVVESLELATSVIGKYREIGTPDAIAEGLEKSIDLLSTIREDNERDEMVNCCESMGIDMNEAKELAESHGVTIKQLSGIHKTLNAKPAKKGMTGSSFINESKRRTEGEGEGTGKGLGLAGRLIQDSRTGGRRNAKSAGNDDIVESNSGNKNTSLAASLVAIAQSRG